MSEYQYYEFLAIDDPLTKKQISELRDISTRAEITPASFINEYNWGDLKAYPINLMKKYFDAHVYVANWCTAIFVIRVPREVISKSIVEAFQTEYVLDFTATKTHWIITWTLEDSEDYDRFALEDGSGWMARLVPIREELLRGDLRSLYIGWLTAAGMGIFNEENIEPIPIPGLANLTASQRALSEFLEVDEDLISGIGLGNPDPEEQGPSQQDIDQWLSDLPSDEVMDVLKSLLAGKGQQVERRLKNRFADWQGSLNQNMKQPCRSVADLLKNAEAAKKTRLEKKKAEKKKLEKKLKKDRDTRLKSLAQNFPKIWKLVEKILETTSASSYNTACSLILDLSEAYSIHATQKAFKEDLHKFMAKNMKRKALI